MKAILIVFAIVLALIVLDILTGMIAAVLNKEYSSSVMREGLLHKVCEVLFLMFGFVLQFGQTALADYDIDISLPIGSALFYGIAGYIVWMEIVSVYENVCKAYPGFGSDRLRSILGLDDKEE